MILTGRRPHGSLNEFLNLTAAASCLIVTKRLLLYPSVRAEVTDNESYLRLHAVTKVTQKLTAITLDL